MATSETLEERQARLFGGTAPWTEVCEFLGALPEATGSEALYELARGANLGPQSVVVEVGAYGGAHALALAERFHCRAIALDLVAEGRGGGDAVRAEKVSI